MTIESFNRQFQLAEGKCLYPSGPVLAIISGTELSAPEGGRNGFGNGQLKKYQKC
jgi:hypothetical protein